MECTVYWDSYYMNNFGSRSFAYNGYYQIIVLPLCLICTTRVDEEDEAHNSEECWNRVTSLIGTAGYTKMDWCSIEDRKIVHEIRAFHYLKYPLGGFRGKNEIVVEDWDFDYATGKGRILKWREK